MTGGDDDAETLSPRAVVERHREWVEHYATHEKETADLARALLAWVNREDQP